MSIIQMDQSKQKKMNFIVGKKLNMTQHFGENGKVTPVTIIKTSDVVVTQVKSTETKDQYNAVQLGLSPKIAGSRRQNKSKIGHSKDLGKFGKFVEFRVQNPADYQIGQKLDLSQFSVGEFVDVIGTSKGRGFAGVIKRHGFAGYPASHGHAGKRMPGSIGQAFPQHVRKGLRMAGHMGNARITVKNLEIIDIDLAKGLLMVKGAVPGAPNGMLRVHTAKNANQPELNSATAN
ncbi:MAG: 50S ribosomal protein L3 [Candidatus Doudnabacteria bacterium]